MSVNIKDILNLEVKREQQILSRLNDLNLDDLSKQEIRQRSYDQYNYYKSLLDLEQH